MAQLKKVVQRDCARLSSCHFANICRSHLKEHLPEWNEECKFKLNLEFQEKLYLYNWAGALV